MNKIRYILRKFKVFVVVYKFLDKLIKRGRIQYRKKIKKQEITKEDILKALPSTGLKRGDKVLVHSSMSTIGILKEGPATFVEALIKYIGTEGLIVMPSFPHTNMYEYLSSQKVFDSRKAPSKNGAITEYFRTRKDTYRSLHPTHPVVAWGKGAEEFVQGHEKSIQPFDANSPYKKMLDMNIESFLVGVNLDHNTLVRMIDDLYEDYEVDYYMPDKIFEMEVIDREGRSLKVKTRCHDPEFGTERNNMRLYPFLRKKIKHGKLFGANTMLMNAQDVFNTQIEVVNRGIHFFHKVPYKNRNRTTETEKA